jgi:hypothetical protein
MGNNIQKALGKQTQAYLNTPFLKGCRDKSLSLQQFNECSLIRFGSVAPLLENLLHRGILLSEAQNQPDLKTALLDNLKDELGIADGELTLEKRGSHASWRQDFLNALTQKPLSSYEHCVRELIETGDLSQIAGAILWLEFSIPKEFRIMLDYLRTKNPQLCADPANIFYLTDHIEHDAKSHFPKLFNAIVSGHLDTNGIIRGIEKMSRSKTETFSALSL